MNAMKDPEVAKKLAFIITNKKLQMKKKSRKGADDEKMPTCVNKFDLLGGDRFKLILKHIDVNIDADQLDMMLLEGLRELVVFALNLEVGCALPTKLWGQLKAECKARYEALGGKRLKLVVFVTKGEGKRKYVEVDWKQGGCYKKLVDRKKQIVAVQSPDGVIAKITGPPLSSDHQVEHNNDDLLAKLTSPTGLAETPIVKLYERAGKLHLIPAKWNLAKVGQATPDTKKAESVLALEDGDPGDDGNDVLAATPPPKRQRVKSPTIAAPQGNQPPRRSPAGDGGVVKASKPPLKKR